MPYYYKRKRRGILKKFREHILIFSCLLAGCILLAFVLVYLMMPSGPSLIMNPKEKGPISTISSPLLPYLPPTSGDASDKNKEVKKFAVPYQKGKVEGNVEVEFNERGEIKKIVIK